MARLGNTATTWRRSSASACRPAAAEKASSPAAAAQPQGRRGRANPGGPIPVVVTVVAPKSMPIIVEAVGTVQAIASIQLKSRIDSQIMKVNVEEGALVKEGDLLFELDARTLQGAARPDRGADPQGPGAGRAGQARFDARRRPAHQGRRHGGDARHQRHHPEGAGGAARVRRGDAPEHPDPDQLHRDPRAGVGPHRLDPQQGRHDAARRRQHRDGGARDHQPGRSDLRAASPSRRSSCRDLRAAMAKGAGQGERGDRRRAQAARRHRLHREHRRSDDRHGDGQGAHRQRQRGPVARPVHQGRGRAGRRGQRARRADAGGPARAAGPVRLRRQGRQHRRGAADHRQPHPGRRDGRQQRPEGRRAGRGRRPAAPGQRAPRSRRSRRTNEAPKPTQPRG